MNMSTAPNREAIAAVPCEGEDTLALFELATGELLGSIPVGAYPVHAIAHAGVTFVATMGERAVSAVTPEGTVERIETGVLGPSHFAVADGYVFVACSAGDSIAVIDSASLETIDRIGVGAEPHELTVGPDGNHLYVGTRRAGTVDIVSVAERAVVDSVDIGPDPRVQGVGLTPDGRRGYAVDQAGDRVVAFDPSSVSEHIADIQIGRDPYDLVVTADRVFVPGRASGTVHEFDRELRSIAVHEGYDRPVDVLRVDDSWWVLDAAEARLTSLDGAVVATPAPGLSAVCWDDQIVVSHYDDAMVSLVDPTDGVIWEATSPANPFGAIVV